MVRALASGQRGYTLAVPLALHVSARIAERDPEDFLRDPTQLANALRDLIEAVGVHLSNGVRDGAMGPAPLRFRLR